MAAIQKTFDNSEKNTENYTPNIADGINYTKDNVETKFFDNQLEKNTGTYMPHEQSNNYEKTFDDAVRNVNNNTNNELFMDSNLSDNTIQNM